MESTMLGFLFSVLPVTVGSFVIQRTQKDPLLMEMVGAEAWEDIRLLDYRWHFLGGALVFTAHEIKFQHFAPVAAEKMHDHVALWIDLDSPEHKPWEIVLETNSSLVNFQREWWCIGKLAFTVLLIQKLQLGQGANVSTVNYIQRSSMKGSHTNYFYIVWCLSYWLHWQLDPATI